MRKTLMMRYFEVKDFRLGVTATKYGAEINLNMEDITKENIWKAFKDLKLKVIKMKGGKK